MNNEPKFCAYCGSKNIIILRNAGDFTEAGCYLDQLGEYCTEGRPDIVSCKKCQGRVSIPFVLHPEDCGCKNDPSCDCGIYEENHPKVRAKCKFCNNATIDGEMIHERICKRPR